MVVSALCSTVFGVAICLSASARADERIRFLHTFASVAGGSEPGPVTGHQTSADPSSWALYGTTYRGGNNYGIAYKLTPPAAGSTQWIETRLYVFKSELDGENPNGPLLFDKSGNAYGVTEQGGSAGSAVALGTIFKLSPPPTGRYFWDKTILHGFTGTDGAFPLGELVMDASGALYGISRTPGGYDWQGVAFRLAPPASGQSAWSFSVLHRFDGGQGGLIGTPLAIDPAGALYGINEANAGVHCPQFYKLTPPAGSGAWSFSVPYTFDCQKGGFWSLLRDPTGVFYGTRFSPNYGEVFQLRPPAVGKTTWTETVLHTFTGVDGDFPLTLSRIDNSGSIYGSTADRAPGPGKLAGGVVFRLDPPASGTTWSFTPIAITSQNKQTNPSGLLAKGPSGAIYTSMPEGGARAADNVSQGAVFQILP